MGFDMTHLLDNGSDDLVFTVLFYLFHRIESLFTGQLVGLYLDEGWQYLNHPYWQKKLKSYLLTLRKKNVYIVFSTQSPSSVTSSLLCDELIQGSASNIFFGKSKS